MKRALTTLVLLFTFAAAAPSQVRTFHNIPYAHAQRYEQAVIADGWDRTADYSQRGPQCPQTKTENDMFRAGELPQSEDCLVLSVNTPDPDGKLPVVVFIHGGSHHHGSGEWEVYDASGLAEEQGIVTVTVSFRHGVFGYLYDGRRKDSNLGYEDQVLALKWLRDNIADFGGDPGNITLVGQSAGAQSVVYLINRLEGKYFRRAIVFSAPFFLNQKTSKAAKNAGKFLEILGKDPLEATQEELVAAEATFKKEVGGGAMAFCPSGMEEYCRHIKSGVEDVVVTYQEYDGAMWAMDFKGKELPEFGTKGDLSLANTITGVVFKGGADKYTRRLQKQGVNASEYLFTWCPPGANWRSAHGLEIAFLFGSKEYILGYGLAGDTTAGLYDEVCSSFRKTVADFARTGIWECSYGKTVR